MRGPPYILLFLGLRIMKDKLKVLYVEDNKDHQLIMERSLKQESPVKFDFHTELRGSSGISLIESNNYDLVFLDYKLPDMDGMEVLSELERKNINIPVIMVTGQGNEQLAVDAIKKGAQDYIVKSDITPSKIWGSIEYALEYSDKEQGEDWKEAEEGEIPEKEEVEQGPVAVFKGEVVIRGSGGERKNLKKSFIKIKDNQVLISNEEEYTVQHDNLGSMKLSQWSPDEQQKAISITEKDENRVFLINLKSKSKIKIFFYRMLKQIIDTKAAFGRHHLKGNSKGRWEVGEIEILKNSILLTLQSNKVLIDLDSVRNVKNKKVKRKRRRAYLLGIKHTVSGQTAYTTIGVYKKKIAELLNPYLGMRKNLED